MNLIHMSKSGRKRPSTGGPGNLPARHPTPDSESDPEIREAVEHAINPIVAGPQRIQVVERMVGLIRTEFFRGPIPHPKHFQEYEQICPGAADRIIRMAETAQLRREDRNDKLVELEYADRRLGLWFGLIALLAFLIAGTMLTVLGEVKVGAGLLSAAAIGTVVGTFIPGRIPLPKRRERQQSDKKP
jgi:uncharacterized membrane protein